MSDVVVYGMPISTDVRTVRMALETASELGADAVRPKPFPLEDLRKTVTRHLEDRGGNQ